MRSKRLHSLAWALGAGLSAVAIGAPVAPAVPPQAVSSAEDETSVFRTGTAAVVLDVVVRDKKGRPVRDISPDEVEVYENGLQQKIEGFERVETEPSRIEGTPPEVERPDASRQMNVVTLAFDGLGVDGRRLAQRAAEALLDKGLRANAWVSVFRLDQGLVLIQPFTNDAGTLKKAIAEATSGTFMGVIDQRAALQQALADLERASEAVAETGEGALHDGEVLDGNV